MSESVEAGAVKPVDDIPVGVTSGDSENIQKTIIQALKHVKLASLLRKGKRYELSLQHYNKALALYPNGASYFGCGVCLAALRRRAEAVHAFKEALQFQPNMAGAHINLSGILQVVGDCEGAVYHGQVALELEPGSREAIMNLSNTLRILNRREEAIKLVWEHITSHETTNTFSSEVVGTVGKSTESLLPPGSIYCQEWKPVYSDCDVKLTIVCIKWGTRYEAEYVNRLFHGVCRHLSRPIVFICFTENGDFLDENIEVRSLPNGLPLWWGKAYLFSEAAGLDGGRVLCLDLDQVIVGALDELADYMGPFALLATDGISCELAAGGYNSSVMAWEASPFFRSVYTRLTPSALHYVHRFDHWLEMMVLGADLWQKLVPGCVVDYTAFFLGGKCIGSEEAEEHLVDSSMVTAMNEEGRTIAIVEAEPAPHVSVVTFPRSPKPHEVVEQHTWIRCHWLATH